MRIRKKIENRIHVGGRRARHRVRDDDFFRDQAE